MIWLILLAAVVMLAAAALLHHRTAVIEAFPAARPWLDAIGFGTNYPGYGLELGAPELVAQGVRGDGSEYAVYAGEIRNTTDRAVEVPIIRASLRDANRDLQAMEFLRPTQDLIPAGGSMRYRIELPAAPDIDRLELEFVASEADPDDTSRFREEGPE